MKVRRGGAVLVALCIAVIMSACGDDDAAQGDVRPVRAVTVAMTSNVDAPRLTGEIAARYESDLGFRTDGKIIARPVDVGTLVKKDDVLARLDPQPRQQDLQAAKAAHVSAQASLSKAQSAESRQSKLLKDGYATQAAYDDALSGLRTAQSNLDSAAARLKQAQDNVGYTELRADADGVITAVSANVGQVVTAGQSVVRLAQPNEREAVFNISDVLLHNAPKDPVVTVTLASNPSVATKGTVRYVSPQADPVTRTYQVRISLPDAPQIMMLGTTVTGTAEFVTQGVIALPGSALFQQDDKPAVWVIDPKTNTVSLKVVKVERYTADRMFVSEGLASGDTVVTAGVQKLVAGQKVRLLNQAPQ